MRTFGAKKSPRLTMVWSCAACTYANASDDAWACEICATRRPRREGNHAPAIDLSKDTADVSWRQSIVGRTDSASSTRSMKQMNLFGKFAAKAESPKKSRVRKRKDPPMAAAARNITAENQPKICSSAPSFSGMPPGSRKTTVTTQSRMPTNEVAVRGTLSQRVRWTESFDKLWEKADDRMKTVFKISSLRNLQPMAIETALRRQNQIVVMATGGGKSLCYQLPATVVGGVTLVVSPLIALMVDQVAALNGKGVAAALISSASGAANNRNVMERLLGRPSKPEKKGKHSGPLMPVTILYVTPELLQTERFRDVLTELYEKDRLAFIAIDEAHCLSTWGHDFRPAYRKLQWLRTTLPTIPVMACTATATAKVISDIRETLLLPVSEAPCHIGSFNRPNISYEVRFKDSLDATNPRGAVGNLVDFIKTQHVKATERSVPCSGIVYCHKRQDTEELAKQIADETGIRTAPYHAGLKDAERKEIQEAWTNGGIQVAFATVAFGMGIDLAHVRYVVHWTLAKTVEGFYQESGRAGRDDLPAVSILYFSKDEVSRFSYLIQQQSYSAKDPQKAKQSARSSREALQRMESYCLTPCCRRTYLLQHFGESIDPKGVCKKTCDYCLDPGKTEKAIDASQFINDTISSNDNPSPANWDGQWKRPHGEIVDDSDNECGDHWAEGDLTISAPAATHYSNTNDIASSKPSSRSFAKVSSILEKYEVIEAKENTSSGFVRFTTKCILRSKNGKQRTETAVPVIPHHLRNNLPDPLSHLSTTVDRPMESTTANAQISGERRQEKSKALQQQREEMSRRLKELHSKPNNPLPPPPVAFSSRPKKG